MTKGRIVIVVNDASFFVSHRMSIALAAREVGYDVHIATPPGSACDRIIATGLEHHTLPMTRRGALLHEEVGTFFAFRALYRTLRPSLVHHVTLKPILYGSWAARLQRVPAVVNAVAGLGYLFSAETVDARFKRALVLRGLRVACAHTNHRLILQNSDDATMLLAHGVARPDQIVQIQGSGVDLTRFVPSPEPAGPRLVVLCARLLWHKGVGEFVEAARTLRQDGLATRFALVGDSDPGNPAAVPRQQLEAWQAEGAVEWWGHREDMPVVFALAHVVCLPSSYREGVPKVLLEAAAAGRAVVSTDTPGCRDVVRHGVTGLLVPPRDVPALTEALRRLLQDEGLRGRMGAAGRETAEREFGVDRVVAATLRVYSELLA